MCCACSSLQKPFVQLCNLDNVCHSQNIFSLNTKVSQLVLQVFQLFSVLWFFGICSSCKVKPVVKQRWTRSTAPLNYSSGRQCCWIGLWMHSRWLSYCTMTYNSRHRTLPATPLHLKVNLKIRLWNSPNPALKERLLAPSISSVFGFLLLDVNVKQD